MRDILYPWSTSFRLLEQDDCYLMNITYGLCEVKRRSAMSIQAFTIDIAQSTLDDLRERLARTRWPDEVEGASWDYGTNLNYLKALVDYWQYEFKWRTQEERLNQFAHFRADIDGVGIHFIHERGRGPDPLPLLLTHGWPGSFFELLKIL